MFRRQKTKIVATLGDPEPTDKSPFGTYQQGVFGLDQKQVSDLTLQHVVDLFFENGVDVIRINLAHIRLEDLEKRFLAIKKAILTAETKFKRRVGLLADLPGPKIRFHSSWWVVPEQELRLSFDRIEEDLQRTSHDEDVQHRPERSLAQVNLDEKAFSEEKPGEAKQILDNVARALADRDPTNPLLAFIGDNDCTLEVTGVEDSTLCCRVIAARNVKVGKKKGFTVRGIPKPIQAFTGQDKAKLTRLLELDRGPCPGASVQERILSHLGISFCQTREDVRQVALHVAKHFLGSGGFRRLPEQLVHMPLFIAKIETEKGVDLIDDILDIADGAMIARGDLALEIETARLPEQARKVIARCNLRGKPVIMATQMLESMKNNIECSRPEATDVFDAALGGVDALMLSGETSSGKYPAHAICKMKELAFRAEEFLWASDSGAREVEGSDFREGGAGTGRSEGEDSPDEDRHFEKYFEQLRRSRRRVADWSNRWDKIREKYEELHENGHVDTEALLFVSKLAEIKSERLLKQNSTDRISHAACTMSVENAVKAIIAPTTSGRTARMLARFRPRAWICAQPHSPFTARKLQLDRGVWVHEIIKAEDDFEQLLKVSKQALRAEFANQVVIFICGIPLGKVGTTNLIQRWDPSMWA
jgi:pyruvate kinase